MKVTKQNYEEYALDYIEGTLSRERQRAFERFLDENPEIAAEVRALREELPVLVPDLSVRFEDKSSLKRRSAIRPLYLRIASAAAVLLAGVLIVNHYRQGDVEPLPAPDQPLLGSVEATGEPAAMPSEEIDVSENLLADAAAENLLADAAAENLLADAAPAPVRTTVKTQPAVSTPLAGSEDRRLTPEHSADLPAQTRASRIGTEEQRPERQEEQRPAREEETNPTREAIAENHGEQRETEWLPVTQDVEYQAPDPVLLAEAPAARVVSVTHEFVIEQSNEPVPVMETRDYFAEDKSQGGFLNVLTRKGFRKLASDILTPLSGISPIKVYENNEERVVEFASIPVSRKSKQENEEPIN